MEIKPYVVVMDNNPGEGRALQRHLKRSFSVTYYQSGEDLLAGLDSGIPVDVFVFDYHMGNGDNGARVLSIIREKRRMNYIPAVLVSQYEITDHIRAEANSAGFDNIIPKGPDTYIESLKSVLSLLAPKSMDFTLTCKQYLQKYPDRKNKVLGANDNGKKYTLAESLEILLKSTTSAKVRSIHTEMWKEEILRTSP